MPSLWFEQALLPEGWAKQVRVTFGATVERVEAGVPPAVEEDRRGIGVPGLCNVHSHGFQRALLAETRGPVGDNFWTWRAEMYRFLEILTPEDVCAITAQAYCEMLESGFTRVGEFHYLHHDANGTPYDDVAIMAHAVAEAARDTGISLTLLPVLYAHSDFGGAPPTHGQRRFICQQDLFARLFEESRKAIASMPDARLGVAPHSLRAVTPEELAFASTLEPAGPVHIHAAEQLKEVEACVAWSGQRPVEWLLNHAQIDARWTLIHATHLTEPETVALARSGAQAGLCPVTEANLGDGVFPTEQYLNEGGKFGVGTDSNIAIDAGSELRAVEYAQRLVFRARNVLATRVGSSTGGDLFRLAQAGGAAALATKTGLVEGAPANFIALSSDHPSMLGRAGDAALDGWVFGAGAAGVDAVWCNGVSIVSNGRHRRREEIQSQYSKVVRKLVG